MMLKERCLTFNAIHWMIYSLEVGGYCTLDLAFPMGKTSNFTFYHENLSMR